jgi:hypothetical protein
MRRRKNRGLRAPLGAFKGAAQLSQRAPKGRAYSAHGWASERAELDPRRHAEVADNVRAKLRDDARVILATLDAFGMGGATRVVVMVERPLVRGFVDAANESHTERVDESIAHLVRVARSDGHLLTIAPIATIETLVLLAAPSSIGWEALEDMRDLAAQTPAPLVIATRYGLSIESLEGRSL